MALGEVGGEPLSSVLEVAGEPPSWELVVVVVVAVAAVVEGLVA